MERRPGTPSLLRELNDRAALELLLTGGPMTRAQLGERTGLSKVTASQLLARLEERGPGRGGRRAGGRPRAERRPLRRRARPPPTSPGCMSSTTKSAPAWPTSPGGSSPRSRWTRTARATRSSWCAARSRRPAAAAGISPEALRAFVIGTPGVLDPRTGDLRLAVNLPAWHDGVHDALRADLGRPVTIENDVNLAAMAERAVGAAAGRRRLRAGLDRGRPRPGDHARRSAAPGRRPGRRARSATCRCPGRRCRRTSPTRPRARSSPWSARRRCCRSRPDTGSPSPPPGRPSRAAVAAAAAGDERGGAFLTELAGRVATGVASVSVVLDPGLVVLGGEVGLAGGTALARPGRGRGGPDLPGPAAGRPDRRDRRPGAARRDPGRGRPGPRRAARLRGEHVNRAERWLPPSWRSTERR